MRKLLAVLGVCAALVVLASCMPAGTYTVGNGAGQAKPGPYLMGGTTGSCAWSVRHGDGSLTRGSYGAGRGPYLVAIQATDLRFQTSCSVNRTGCNPNYGRCIPGSPPDLDCPQIPFRGFRVGPGDPHGFDTDHDGIGCET
jgi:micrococcal nuclease